MEANSVSGHFLYSTAGTGAGDQHEVSSYGTIGVFTWAVAGTAPTSTTTWIRMAIRPQLILDAIDEVTRRAWRKQAIPYLSEAIVTNNLLTNGSMEEWSSGASSAPDGWALAGAGAAVARTGPDSSNRAQGIYAAQVTAGGGAVGTLTKTLPIHLMRLCDGTSLTLLGIMQGATAADVVARVAITNSAGTVTNTDRTGTLAGNRWEELSDISSSGISCPDPVADIALQLRTAAGLNGFFDDMVLHGPHLYNYPLPRVLIGLGPIIWMETAYRNNQFTIPLYYGADWIIQGQDSVLADSQITERVLHLIRSLPSGRHLRIAGYRAPDVQATATSNVEPNPVWLATAAAVRLMEQQDIAPGSSAERRLNNLRLELARLEATTEGNTLKGIAFVPIEPR